MKKISIIILHFQDQELTADCLKSIKKLNLKDIDLQVLIVNNNPEQDLAKLEKTFADFTFIKTKTNLGYAQGNNFGIEKALEEKPDFVFLLNNDTILDKDLLVKLIDGFKKDKKIGIIGPKIYFAKGYEFHKNRYQKEDLGKVIWYAGGLIDWQNIVASHRGVDEVDKGQYDQFCQTNFISGCAMMIKREVFEKIGFFNKNYFLYWEDVDFCQRAFRAGFTCFYDGMGKLWHANAGSSKVGGALHDYYMTRNRLLFGLKYADFKTKLALVRQSSKLLSKGSFWQKKGVLDFYTFNFGKGSYE